MTLQRISISLLAILLFLGAISCNPKGESKDQTKNVNFTLDNPQGVSVLGRTLNSPNPSTALTKRWLEKAHSYNKDPQNIDNIIWFGRFTAYMGDYKRAISIYTEGIKIYPNDARLLRHRGHRYITIRKFDEAIVDLKRAAALRVSKENEVEADGMPNAQNIPVSTLHGNIYYHLGLSYYLKNDLPNALSAYQECLKTSQNPDNIVSATHWIFSILSKLKRHEEARESLQIIVDDMPIIENHSYYALCLFYKGLLSEKQLLSSDNNTSANDAIKYGLGNWLICHDEKEKGIAILTQLSQQDSWASFGSIGAESDLARIKSYPQ